MFDVLSMVIGNPNAVAVDDFDETDELVSVRVPVAVATLVEESPVPGAGYGPAMQLVDSPGASEDANEQDNCSAVRVLSETEGVEMETSPEFVIVNRYHISKPDVVAVATFNHDDALVGSLLTGS